MHLYTCVALVTAISAGIVDAGAAELVVDIEAARNRPIADAVVSVRGENSGRAAPVAAPILHTIDQRNETFIPYVEIFRPGDSVVFRNSDTTRHHVYSFAAVKSFEFIIPRGQSAPPVLLDRVGEVPVGCNIHDPMITHLYISDAPWLAKSEADGRVRFEGLPAGRYEVQVWHPQLREGDPGPVQSVVVGRGENAVAFTLSLLPDPRGMPADRERGRY